MRREQEPEPAETDARITQLEVQALGSSVASTEALGRSSYWTIEGAKAGEWFNLVFHSDACWVDAEYLIHADSETVEFSIPSELCPGIRGTVVAAIAGRPGSGRFLLCGNQWQSRLKRPRCPFSHRFTLAFSSPPRVSQRSEQCSATETQPKRR